MTLVEDWFSFVDGRRSFDIEHFTLLFRGDSGDDDIRRVCSVFNGGEAAAARIIELRQSGDRAGFDYVVPPDRDAPEIFDYQETAQDILDGLINYFDTLGEDELVDELRSLSLQRADSLDHIRAELDNDENLMTELIDQIDDNFPHKKIEPVHAFSALKEAALNLTMEKDVTRYLLDPIVQHPLDPEPPYLLWKFGGAYVATNEAFLFYAPE